MNFAMQTNGVVWRRRRLRLPLSPLNDAAAAAANSFSSLKYRPNGVKIGFHVNVIYYSVILYTF